MQSLSTCLVAAALLVAVVNAQFQINTPASVTECVPVQFTWTGGQEPYFLRGIYHAFRRIINPGGVPGATAFQQYSGVTGTSFTWSANISSGTSIGLQLTDTNGQIAQSAPVTIQAGVTTSCLTSDQSSAASGSSTPATGTVVGTSAANTASSTGAPATTTKTGASSSGTGAGTASGSKTSGSASSASTSASGSSGALSNVASAGVVGLVGALAAALLA
ncbi:hypothetical protein LXA43DRAFT_1138120 [Ganoderma leucocontextum]|nr:hypothetical protein LXA43DRAFT_1138120 [Ganoderma leucocontextum]